MNIKLKPISEQTIVITGASSGIGLVTARMAVARGARVVVAARQENALEELERQLNADSGRRGIRAVHVAADVKREQDVQKITQTAIDRFGGFDTWVNDAGTSVYGRISEVPVEDEQEVFAVNFWGAVYGMRVALEHLRQKGGAIINVGSEVSDTAVPLQAAYSATKHAMKAYTSSLRVELQDEGVPISVTLIKPTGIATPFFEHAKNYMDKAPKAPSPMYTPELVAEAIIYAAEHPTRELLVGDKALLTSAMSRFAPALGDKFMRTAIKGQQSSRHAKPGENRALNSPSGTLKERGDYYDVQVLDTSIYNKAAKHPWVATVATAAAGLALAAVLRRK